MLAVATLTATAAVCAAQTASKPGPASANSMQMEAAPIEHAYPNQTYPNQNAYSNGQLTQATIAPGEDVAPGAREAQTTPIQGVILRVGAQSVVREVSSEPGKLELSVEHGLANVNVHKPAKDTLILVDLPGGQTQLLKDGLYTFNAETNTARVLKGEALAFPQGETDAKPLKVKEYNKVVFNGAEVKPHEFVPYEAQMDLLPGPAGPRGEGGAAPGYGYGYGYGPYGDGFYGGYPYYPYYAYGYPAWGYPYGYGFYPYGVGLGFTYYGGYHGYHGGFHGGGVVHGGGHGRR